MNNPYLALLCTKTVFYSVLEFNLFEEVMCLQAAYQQQGEAEEVVASICKKFILRMAESMKKSCQEGDLVKVNHPGIAIGSMWEGMMTPLCSAAMRGKHQVVARLLEAGANVNWQDENGTTALAFAVARRRYGSELPLDEEGSDLDETIRLLSAAGGRMLSHGYGDY